MHHHNVSEGVEMDHWHEKSQEWNLSLKYTWSAPQDIHTYTYIYKYIYIYYILYNVYIYMHI